jgi:hypothetical protein
MVQYVMEFYSIYTFKALKMIDKRRGERILLFSSAAVIVAFI